MGRQRGHRGRGRGPLPANTFVRVISPRTTQKSHTHAHIWTGTTNPHPWPISTQPSQHVRVESTEFPPWGRDEEMAELLFPDEPNPFEANPFDAGPDYDAHPCSDSDSDGDLNADMAELGLFDESLGNGAPPHEDPSVLGSTSNRLLDSDDYLEEVESMLLLGESCLGIGCSNCNTSTGPFYTCHRGCSLRKLQCGKCIVSQHADTPYHSISRWDSGHGSYSPTSLKNLGHVLEVPHLDHSHCSSRSSVIDVSVMHLGVINTIAVRYCDCGELHLRQSNCEHAGKDQSFCLMCAHQDYTLGPAVAPYYLQLMSVGIFPATRSSPRSGYTFETLMLFDHLSLKSRVNGHQFCDTHSAVTEEFTGVNQPNLYKHFLPSLRVYRHERSTLEAKVMDSLIEDCPACPNEGVNLPENWREEPPRDRDLKYSSYRSGDGNFHLQLRENKPSLLKDPSLWGDEGFWAPQAAFEQYIANAKDAKGKAKKTHEPKCHSQAGNPSREQPGLKLAVTGIFAILCIHSYFLKNAVVDFTRGEGYDYCDVALAFVLNKLWKSGLFRVVFTYDVNCKYRINLYHRLSCQNAFGSSPLSEDLLTVVKDPARFLAKVNSWHLGTHIPECADDHSLAHTLNVGLFTGEAVETPWARLNGLQYSTREMGAGHRRDVISVAMNYWNKEKTAKICIYTWKKYTDAVRKYGPLNEELKDLENQLPEGLLVQWLEHARKSGGDQFRLNAQGEYPSLQQTMTALKAEEKINPTLRGPGNSTLSQLLLDALELQDEQITFDRGTKKPGTKQRRQLTTNIESFHHHLRLLVPGIPPASVDIAQPQHAPLHLPSNPTHGRLFPAPYMEWEIACRIGHGHDILGKLRRCIGTRSYSIRQNRGVPGYAATTKAQESSKRSEATKSKLAAQYRANWKALQQLGQMPNAMLDLAGLQELADNDMHIHEKWKESLLSSNAEIPWIWRVPMLPHKDQNGTRSGDDQFNKAIRVEWANLREQVARTAEEVVVKKEDMKRNELSFRYRKELWEDLRKRHENMGVGRLSWRHKGLAAYAYRKYTKYDGREQEAASYIKRMFM